MIDIKLLADARKPLTGPTLFISIDGHGGSGKSTLAKSLAPHLGATVIHTDDFASIDNPRDWGPRLVQAVFLPVESGETKLSYERSKCWSGHEPEPVIDQPVSEIMIIEGVGSSQLAFRKYIGMSIFVDTPVDICLQRGIARDLDAKAGSEMEIATLWKEWIQEEKIYFENDDPKNYAEIVVDGAARFDEQIAQLK